MIYIAVCESCLQERLEEERRSQLVYNRATIYVRQVDKIGIVDILMDVAPSTPAEDPDFQVKSHSFLPPLQKIIKLLEWK